MTTETVLDAAKKIPTNRTTRFIERWRALNSQRATLDHETAMLAHEVRSEFTGGPSGDYQFRIWVRKHLEVSGNVARMLVEAARSIRLGYGKQEDWTTLGGWRTIAFLLNLKTPDRRKLTAAALEKSKKQGHPISHYMIRDMAFKMGVRSNRAGRPTRSEAEEKVATLRLWISKLYEEFQNLPPPPPEVIKALNRTKLEAIKRGLEQAAEAMTATIPNRAERVKAALATAGD